MTDPKSVPLRENKTGLDSSERTQTAEDNSSLKISAFWKERMNYISVGVLCFCALFLKIYQTSDCFNPQEISELAQKNNSWDYLRFTQQWPPSVCISPKTQHCTIPEKSQFWTIHGIWPDCFNDTQTPFSCNNTWHFNETEIMSIEGDMEFMWPDLMDSKSSKSFWQHEWTKHGTCAASLPELNTILKYFSKGLELKKVYDILVMLSKEGIKPDPENTVLWSTVQEAFLKTVGFAVRVDCSFRQPTADSVPLLSVVEICFDKSFELFDCPDFNTTNCPRNKGLIFLPLVAEKSFNEANTIE